MVEKLTLMTLALGVAQEPVVVVCSQSAADKRYEFTVYVQV